MKIVYIFYFFIRKNNLKDIYYCNIYVISYSKIKKNDSIEGGFFQEIKKSCNLQLFFL